jgi:hypothetical protein
MTAPELKPETCLSRKEGIELRSIERGALLVDLSSGRCYRLNAVGAEVWRALAAATPCRELYGRIADRYRIPLDRAESDIGDLVRELLRAELVQIEPGAPR